MSYFVPTKFVWRFGGNQVHLCGSFTRWVETVPMTTVDGQPGTFTVVVHLPPGYHQYKFIVDGEWRHDESQPFMPDPLGNVNNWLFVRKPEGQASQGHNVTGALHQSLQQQQQQQHAQHHAAANQHQHQQHNHVQQQQMMHHHVGPGGGNTAPSSRAQSVADMDVTSGELGGGSGGIIAPFAAQTDEPGHTKKKVLDFLNHHSAYELIPESGKVVLLDVDLPMRQAFHALHEQGIASAPLWDGEQGRVCGMLSASDFIHMLQRLRSVVSSSANPMSEQEMDLHTIRSLREELEAEGKPPKVLVAVRPSDSLAAVVRTLLDRGCSMAPVLCNSSNGPSTAGGIGGAAATAAAASTSSAAAAAVCMEGDVLHTATISGVLACLMRHFRASLASLPLLAQPLSALPIGTWGQESSLAATIQAEEQQQQQQGGGGGEQALRRRRRVAKLACVRPDTPLTQALGLLLEAGVSCLPVVDAAGVLLDIYARADITMLAKSNAYTRLQFEDVTVGQALALAGQPLPPPQAVAMAAAASAPPQWGNSPRGSNASLADSHSHGHGGHASHGSMGNAAAAAGAGAPAAKQHRVHVCTPQDALRTVVERLSVPGVRRLVVVDGESRRVEGIVSLSDIAAYLLL